MQERKIIALLRERDQQGLHALLVHDGRCAIRHRSHSAGPSGAGGGGTAIPAETAAVEIAGR